MKPQSLLERVSSLVPDPTDQIAGRVWKRLRGLTSLFLF